MECVSILSSTAFSPPPCVVSLSLPLPLHPFLTHSCSPPRHTLLSSIAPTLPSKCAFHNKSVRRGGACIAAQELCKTISSAFAQADSRKGDTVLASEQADMEYKEGDFVEVGVITGMHGISGELQVRSSTDFPEERFEKPGLRWLKMRHMSTERIQCVELMKGRNGPGKYPSWLITLKDIETPEKAREFVGATMLARVSERPVLEDVEFYIPDLVGMSVVMKDSGETVGLIVDVFSTGASDLLRVRLHASKTLMEEKVSISPKSSEQGLGQLIWVPFVEQIVPVVNLEQRFIEITPPMGLLELNLKSEGSSIVRQRKQEAKDKRKLKGKMAGLKKSLASLKQEHVLAGLKLGGETQKRALLDELLKINFTELQQQFQDALSRSNSNRRTGKKDSVFFSQLAVVFASWLCRERWGRLSDHFVTDTRIEGPDDVSRWQKEGLRLIMENKVAVITLIGECTPLQADSHNLAATESHHLDLWGKVSPFQVYAEQLCHLEELASLAFPNAKSSMRWLIMTTDLTDYPIRLHFETNKFFGLNESQIWFFKQGQLPCFERKSAEGHYQILMETPWKMAQTYIGDGGIFSSLTDQGLLKKLFQDGRDYLQIFNMDCPHTQGLDPVLFGCLHDLRADVGIEVGKRCSELAMGNAQTFLKESKYNLSGAQSRSNCGIESPSSNNSGYTSLCLNESATVVVDSQTISQDAGAWNIHMEHEESVCSSNQNQGLGRTPVLQVSPCGNYVISMDFLTRLQEHNYRPLYNALYKEISVMEEIEGMLEQNKKQNAIQLDCSFFNFLSQSKPNKVAVFLSS